MNTTRIFAAELSKSHVIGRGSAAQFIHCSSAVAARMLLLVCLPLLGGMARGTAGEAGVLMPSPNTAPEGSAYDVIPDPHRPGEALLLGAHSSIGSILRVSVDSSGSQVDALDNRLGHVNRLAYNPGDGLLYAVGSGAFDPKAPRPTDVWMVRRSATGDPGTWETADQFFLGRKATTSRATGVAIDSMGTVYVSGLASDGKNYRWIIRRQLGGGEWATVFNAVNPNINLIPRLCFFPGNAQNPSPAMLAVGELNGRWTVLRNLMGDLATRWTDIDPQAVIAFGEATASDISSDTDGKLYVVGFRGLDGRNPRDWLVRCSKDGGTHWHTVLDGRTEGPAAAARVGVGLDGNVIISGSMAGAWHILRCSDPTDPVSWSNAFGSPLHLQAPFGTTYSRGRGVAVRPDGNLFVTGFVGEWVDGHGILYAGNRIGLVHLAP